MLHTRQAEAFTPASTSDYLSPASLEPALPPNLADFMTPLGPEAKDQHDARRHLQQGFCCHPPGRRDRDLTQFLSFLSTLPHCISPLPAGLDEMQELAST